MRCKGPTTDGSATDHRSVNISRMYFDEATARWTEKRQLHKLVTSRNDGLRLDGDENQLLSVLLLERAPKATAWLASKLRTGDNPNVRVVNNTREVLLNLSKRIDEFFRLSPVATKSSKRLAINYSAQDDEFVFEVRDN
jgi:hypothetical protein